VFSASFAVFLCDLCGESFRFSRRIRPWTAYLASNCNLRLILFSYLAFMSAESTPSRHWHAVTAAFLGWTLDAFDFFVLVFLFDTLAAQFHITKTDIVFTITLTLAMRPVGAIIFGLLADRYGRRRPLMANVIFFSVIELLCGFAPNYRVFLVLRAICGIGMGGEWGVGVSLVMGAARV